MTERDPLNLAGQTVAEKYLVERLVGEGGFAVVYRAVHTIWNKPVAIKFFNGLSSAPADQRESLMQDFINEGALLTELSSQTASIVQARDVGTYTSPDGLWMPYMVLEWLDGKPLDAILELEHQAQAPVWSMSEVYQVLEPVALALNVAHNQGIAHRDIKPANLFVIGPPRSPASTVKVLDFGVAKMMSDNTHLQAALAKTGTNITSFTPQYGAPEQFSRSHGATGPWTDVYALALVAVEMLSGKPALDGGDLIQLAFSSANPERRPTPRSLGLDLGDAVEAVFSRALAVAPAQRYASAGEFISSLAIALGYTLPQANSLRNPSPVSMPSSAFIGAAATQLSHSSNSPTTAATVTTQAPAPQKSGNGLLYGGLGVAALAAIGIGAVALQWKSKGAESGADGSEATPPPSAAVIEPPKPFTCPEDMVKIPKGQFFMGSASEDAMANEQPTHNVQLNAFCMDLHEVTTTQYKGCSDDGKCLRAPREVKWASMSEKQKETYSPLCNINEPEAKGEHPINCVTWNMADNYCKAQGKRLPTEAEWEYATRGPDGRVYPWGDDEPTAEHLNACGTECVKWGEERGEELTALYEADDGYPTTAPVGKFPKGASRFGPFDVAGNVWEWVADYEGAYSSEPLVNPTGPESGDKRVIRGGAFNGSFASWLRPSFRYAATPDTQSHGYGFRCAMNFEEDSAGENPTPAGTQAAPTQAPTE